MQTTVEAGPLALEMHFTEVYRRYEHAHPAIREAMCLKTQYPAVLAPPREGDRFAGRMNLQPWGQSVGFIMSHASPDMGFVCCEARLRRKLAALGLEEQCQQELWELLDFWQERTTRAHFWSRVISERPVNIERALPDRQGPGDIGEAGAVIATFGDRMATANLDFDKLLRLGIPGLLQDVESYRAKAAQDGGDEQLFVGMRMCLELLTEVCTWYARQAREQGLVEMAEALEHITVSPPGTLHEAIQLFWLYAMLAQITNFGRMDVYLGDFLARDLDSGILSEAEALSLLEALWAMMVSLFGSGSGAGRVIIGGLGRRNEGNADRFALAAMEATRTTRALNPQLTLRIHRGMNPALMQAALSVLAEGITFPVLINDDVNVPALQCAFSCSPEEAQQYVLSNCGDIGLDHLSFGSPNSLINVAKALEVTLHDGVDPVSGQTMGLALGRFEDFATFEELFAAYSEQVTYLVEAIADRNEAFNDVLGENAFLFVSLLYDDCLERGKPAFGGGIRYLGGLLETYGNITAADSLTAIKELIYDKKLLTPQQMLAALDGNFEGYEREWALMRQCPKFGNDDPQADAMAGRVNEQLYSAIWRQKDRTRLDFFLAENVNAGGNVQLGVTTSATPDGRRAGLPLSNANNPTSGNDRQGPTALLNSMAKLDVSLSGPGVFHNLHLNRDLFQSSPERVRSLLDSFFASGGSIIQVSAISRRDLEDALKHPQNYQGLIVRVGGFSARFVELNKDLQMDIVQRTVY